MATAKMTLRLPEEKIGFAKEYAKEHGMTLTALVRRYFTALEQAEERADHPKLAPLAGLIPSDVNVKEEHAASLLRKHQ